MYLPLSIRFDFLVPWAFIYGIILMTNYIFEEKTFLAFYTDTHT